MSLSTADLPASFYLDPAVFETAKNARAAGLTLARSACRCAPARDDCSACLTATLRGLAPA